MLCRCGTQCHVTLTEFTLFSGVISGCKGSCSNQFGISGCPETWIMPDELNGAILFIHLFFLSGRCFVFVFCFCFFHLTLFFKKKKKNTRNVLWTTRLHPPFHKHQGKQNMTKCSFMG